MKRLWIILFVIPLFAQNPCEDKEYQRLNKEIELNGVSSLSEREWAYYNLKDNQCQKIKNQEEESEAIKNTTDVGSDFGLFSTCIALVAFSIYVMDK